MGYIINVNTINANTVINLHIYLLENQTLLATIFSSCEKIVIITGCNTANQCMNTGTNQYKFRDISGKAEARAS